MVGLRGCNRRLTLNGYLCLRLAHVIVGIRAPVKSAAGTDPQDRIMRWTPPADGVPGWCCEQPRTRERSEMQVTTIGLDIAKNVFRVHGIDVPGRVVLRKRLRRGKVLRFFANLP